MKKTMKKMSLLIICISLMLCLVPFIHASSIEPRLTHLSTINANLSISSSNKASCYGVVFSKSLTQPVKVTCLLQQNNNGVWKTLYSWESTGTYSTCVDTYRYVYSGYIYRVCVTGYALDSSGNILESKTVYNVVDYSKG